MFSESDSELEKFRPRLELERLSLPEASSTKERITVSPFLRSKTLPAADDVGLSQNEASACESVRVFPEPVM